MDCRLCEMYSYGRFEGAQVSVHFCKYYNDGLTPIRREGEKYPKLSLYRPERSPDIEVNGALNCRYYKDKDFLFDPNTNEVTYRENHWSKYIVDRILPGMLGWFVIWLVYIAVKDLWNKIENFFN
ncbi:MAG: hypothetical protein FJ139_05020 [Deltaproteobacteria bacterium]|nr:hypothetical protein [Deltaproteobacteria bacterium]